MNLHELTQVLLHCEIVSDRPVEVTQIAADSRQVGPGCLFIAIPGHHVDGHDFVVDSVQQGAVAVVVERPVAEIPIPQVVVPDSLFASAVLAAAFYGHPGRRMRMIGVTGTNGKSTVTHLIERVLQDAGQRPGVCGTLGARIGGEVMETANTTPFPVDLQQILHRMVEAGCTHGVMEVSSHALDRRQTAGIPYGIAVFTNLTQDHLDYHGTMEAYRAAKGKLFSRLGNAYGDSRAETPYAVLNADDPASAYMAAQTVAECVTYGIETAADVQASALQMTADGVQFMVTTWRGERAQAKLSLTGRFNVSNALAAIAVGLVEGVPLEAAVASLGQVAGVPGRLERVPVEAPVTVLVDYAHTPDSLENALRTVREFAAGRVLCLIGCGGDRDKGKRPQMARIACSLADRVALTSDNPRSEDPVQILDDMEAGVRGQADNYVRIVDRAEAIRWLIGAAQPGDVVLVAGKGHETYQIVGRTKHPFDDRAVAAAALRERFA